MYNAWISNLRKTRVLAKIPRSFPGSLSIANIHIYIYIYIFICIRIFIYIYIYIYVYIYIYLFICVFVCIFIHICIMRYWWPTIFGYTSSSVAESMTAVSWDRGAPLRPVELNRVIESNRTVELNGTVKLNRRLKQHKYVL